MLPIVGDELYSLNMCLENGPRAYYPWNRTLTDEVAYLLHAVPAEN